MLPLKFALLAIALLVGLALVPTVASATLIQSFEGTTPSTGLLSTAGLLGLYYAGRPRDLS